MRVPTKQEWKKWNVLVNRAQLAARQAEAAGSAANLYLAELHLDCDAPAGARLAEQKGKLAWFQAKVDEPVTDLDAVEDVEPGVVSEDAAASAP